MAKGSSRKTQKLNSSKTQSCGSRDEDREVPGTRQTPGNPLIDLPLEMLCEILKLLPPLDLLQLSRTAKSFRKFLMDRTSKSIWTHALSAVEDLPPCPEDISEPQYACLMLTDHCHVPLELAEFVPATTNRLTKDELAKSYFKGREPQAAIEKRTRFHVNTALSLCADYKKNKGDRQKKAWIEEQRKIWLVKEESASACERYFLNAQSREVQRARALKEKRIEQIREKLRALGQLSHGSQLFIPRAILTQKYSAGWADELNMMQAPLPYEVYSWQSPAKELTEKEWEEMEDSMVAAMEKRKEKRIKIDMTKLLLDRIDAWVKPAYTSFLFSHPPNTVLPSIQEVCLTEAFRTPLCTLPLDQDLTADLFENAIAQLPSFAEEWRKNRIDQVFEVVQRSATYKKTSAGDLSADTVLPLASSIFHCDGCQQKVTYPYILVHQCLFVPSWEPKLQDFAESMPTPMLPREIKIPDVPSITDDISLILLTIPSVIRIWKGMKHARFDDNAHRHMLALLDALGWSAGTTVSEMEVKQPYVECLCQCFDEVRTERKTPTVTRVLTRSAARRTKEAQKPTAAEISEPGLTKRREAARWTKAIQSCGSHERSESHPECFAKLEGRDLALATTIEQARQQTFWTKVLQVDCFMCMARSGFTRDALENHLLLDHKVEHPDGINGVKAYTVYRKRYQWITFLTLNGVLFIMPSLGKKQLQAMPFLLDIDSRLEFDVFQSSIAKGVNDNFGFEPAPMRNNAILVLRKNFVYTVNEAFRVNEVDDHQSSPAILEVGDEPLRGDFNGLEVVKR
ncbi:hypothetical protein MD484_g8713, partial [Candolleomyces efflorescens]